MESAAKNIPDILFQDQLNTYEKSIFPWNDAVTYTVNLIGIQILKILQFTDYRMKRMECMSDIIRLTIDFSKNIYICQTKSPF